MPASTTPIKHASMRASNLGLVLRAVADGSTTRADVAAATRLTKSSVASLVADLITAGLVAEAAAAPRNEPGRPGSTIQLAPTGPAGLGLEVNVDYLAAVLTDLRGTPRYRHVVHRDNGRRPVAEVFADLRELAARAVAAASEQGLQVAGACVAVPATVRGTTVVSAPNLEWSEVDLAPHLPTAGPLGTTVENEANLAALAELWHGQGPRDFVHVSSEIGIGGGIVVDGALFRGAHRVAGELGHVVVDPDGPECTCGGRGCLERMAGLSAILSASGAADRADLQQRCADDDAAARAAVAAAGRWLGVALASAANLLDPDAVVLGGVFADLEPWLAPSVEAELSARLAHSGGRPRLLTSRLGTDAAVRGAAGSVVRRVVEDPATYLSTREAAAWA